MLIRNTHPLRGAPLDPAVEGFPARRPDYATRAAESASRVAAEAALREATGLGPRSRVLLVNAEGATDPARYRALTGLAPEEVGAAPWRLAGSAKLPRGARRGADPRGHATCPRAIPRSRP